VRDAALRHGVPEDLVLAVIEAESGFREDARSPSGARGLMQLMPATAASLARRMGLEQGTWSIDDPVFNVEAGTLYLSLLLRRFGGDAGLALAAYHAGPARAQEHRQQGRPLPASTEAYVKTVLAARDRFASGTGAPGPPASEAGEPAREDREELRRLIRERSLLPDEAHGEPPASPPASQPAPRKGP
jgi:soluble lytic murein transglycosylase-like protein